MPALIFLTRCLERILWWTSRRAKILICELMEADEVALHVARLCDPRNRNMPGSVPLCDGAISLVLAAEINDQ